MNRRGFLKAFGAAVATAMAVEIDPERLLWTPGTKSFLIPDSPKPKNIIVDVEMVRAEWEKLHEPGRAALFQREILGKREAGTAVGNVVFDADWNALTLSGRPIRSAREAAALIASNYTSTREPSLYNPNGAQYGKFEDLVARTAAKREAAGLKDDVRPTLTINRIGVFGKVS